MDYAKGYGKGKDKGKGKDEKGKAKGKGRPKNPTELNFELSDGGKLWVRRPLLKGGAPVGDAAWSCLEVGNLDEKKLGGKGKERPPLGDATVEVLVNRQSVLGNPFNLGKKVKLESQRDPVIKAYSEFLEVVMAGADQVDIFALARRHGLSPVENCGKDWRETYDDLQGPHGVREAIDELRSLLAETRARRRGAVRLLCHCAPLGCHARVLAERLADDAFDPPAASAPSREGRRGDRAADRGPAPAAAPRRERSSELDGRWLARGGAKDGSLVATIRGDLLRWPSGAEASIVHEGGSRVMVQLKYNDHCADIRKGDDIELYWDDGDVWTRSGTEAAGEEDAEVSKLSKDFSRCLRMDGAVDAGEGEAGQASSRGRWPRDRPGDRDGDLQGNRERGGGSALGEGASWRGGSGGGGGNDQSWWDGRSNGWTTGSSGGQWHQKDGDSAWRSGGKW